VANLLILLELFVNLESFWNGNQFYEHLIQFSSLSAMSLEIVRLWLDK